MTALDKANFWLSQNIDDQTRKAIENMINDNPDELEESFYKELEFGTGGLRGIMGVGSNRMNKYTVGMATQGLANYLRTSFRDEEISVAIAHDSRNNSRFFAETTASIFAGNNIKVYLFEDLRPTPELSYAIRELGCKSGVVLTASHNPKKYNGYKAYWDDGAQLTPPHDNNVIAEVNKIQSFDQIKTAENSDLIIELGAEFDQKYLDAIVASALDRDAIEKGNDIDIVFSSIHGTGITMVPPALKQLGFKNVHTVKEQDEPDGNFPTVIYPNPEEAEALSLGLKLAEEKDADILMATDPDADRVGVAVKNPHGEFELLNGNQMAALMVYYILKTRKAQGTLLANQFVAKTIVTTELIDKMCETYNIPCYNVLTGFKYIAMLIRDLEGKEEFIGGGEESYGFMTSPLVRDKDAVAACSLVAEMAASAKANDSSLYEMLEDMYAEFDVWLEDMKSITIEGKTGQEQIARMMRDFRSSPPVELGGSKVKLVHDYQESRTINRLDGSTAELDFPKSNVLQFVTESGYKVSARPSGTEPKIKFYFSVSMPVSDKKEIADAKNVLGDLIERIKVDLNLPS